MNLFLLLAKISLKYWKTHKGRLYTLMGIIVLGVAALTGSALLIRSEKAAVLEDRLHGLGNYDVIIYGLDGSAIPDIEARPDVDAVGSYTELGYVSAGENSEQYKAACFGNKNDEDMYHMTCTYGRYPENDGEIALDIQTAKQLGIRPRIGGSMELFLKDLDGNMLSRKTYTVCGLFESTSIYYGGFLRYPSNQEVGEYDMPVVYFHAEENGLFQSDERVIFLQSDADNLEKLRDEICGMFPGRIEWFHDTESPSGRRFSYTYVMGIESAIWEQYGDTSITSIMSALRDGNVIRDFYSGVLVPIFNFLIFLVAFLSIGGIVRNIFNDKSEMTAIIRSMGLSAKTAGIYMFFDLFVVSLISSGIGVLVGCVIHIGMIRVMNRCFYTDMQTAFTVSPFVSSVTMNPYPTPVLILTVCFLFSVFFPLMRFVKSTPIELFRPARKNRTKPRSHRKGMNPDGNKSWRKLLLRNMKLRDKGVFIISVILMSVMVFGYVYFCALSDKENIELEYEKEQSGLLGFDYIANRSGDFNTQGSYLENRHSIGIDTDAYETFAGQDYVESSFAEAWNLSTRLSYNRQKTESELLEFLEFLRLRNDFFGKEDFEENPKYYAALAEGENLNYSETGYSEEEELFALPTIAVTDNVLQELEKTVVSGSIDKEALKSGEEVLLVVPQKLQKEVLRYFPAGSELPLSDVVLDDEEEELDFNAKLDPSEEEKYVVYQKTVPFHSPDLSYDTDVIVCSFGKRKDIHTKVGAVAVFGEDQAETYFPTLTDCRLYKDTAGSDYGIFAVCSMEAFAGWGLPDGKYTRAGARLIKDCNAETAENCWYETIGSAKGIKTVSSKEITDRIRKRRVKNMSTYYMMMFLLVVTGLISCGISLYSRTRMQEQSFAFMRAAGMKRKDIIRLLLESNLIYPVSGIVFSVIPVALCQNLFLYVRRMVDSGQWDGFAYTYSRPWYFDIPFRYNLFGYHFGAVLLVTFLVYALVILAATVPQINSVRKQSIVDELEINTF